MKKIENGSTTTTSAKEEVKFYVDLNEREISTNSKSINHVNCILKEQQPFYFLQYEESSEREQLKDMLVECRNMTETDAKAKAEKMAVNIIQFKEPYTPSEYEEKKNDILDEAVVDAKELKKKKSKSMKNNIIDFRLNKATIIFDEMLQDHRLEIEVVKSEKFTINTNCKVELG